MRVTVCLHSANWADIILYPLPNTIYLLPACIELDFSEMTMKMMECDRKRKEGDGWFSSPIGGEIDSNPVWKSESDRFGISSAVTLLVSKVTLLQSLIFEHMYCIYVSIKLSTWRVSVERRPYTHSKRSGFSLSYRNMLQMIPYCPPCLHRL